MYSLIPDWAKLAYYKLSGARPMSRGYFTFKHHYIKEALHDDTVMGRFKKGERLPLQYGHGLDERVCEYPWLLSRIPIHKECRMLDAGSTLNFEEVLEFPALKNKTITIMTLYPEKNCFWQKNISYVFGDLRSTPFRDDFFDVIACISTLEHIGLDNTVYNERGKSSKEQHPSDYIEALKEFKRILKKGGALFVTVPFGRYKNFGWFQQFDQARVKKIIEAFHQFKYTVTYYRYKNGAWDVSDESGAKEMEYQDKREKTIAGAGAVACLELIK